MTYFLTLIFCLTLFSQETITIAVSANMQFAFKDIQKQFETQYSYKIIPVYSSSGTLTTQIINGAPYDIFLSANMDYPNALFSKQMIIDSPRVYAQGQLILWSNKHTINNIFDIKKYSSISIANPKLAPYGIESVKVLDSIQTSARIIQGLSISQVNNYIYSKNVDAGITSKSVVKSKQHINRGSWIDIPKHLYSPIQQGVVQIKASKKSDEFMTFLFSKQVAEILHSYGYLSPTKK